MSRGLTKVGFLAAAGLIALAPATGEGATPPSGAATYKELPVNQAGTLSGTVAFAGPVSGPYVIWPKKDAEVFGEKIPDDRWLISRDGKVQNAVVILEGVASGKAWPTRNPTLDNRGGRFVPHVQVARRGAQLEIVNSDPVLHNTHGYQEGRTVFNLALPNQGQRIRQTLRRAGVIEVMCDSHDWMSGWVIVLDHPYFAITGPDGAFEIRDIPAGTYKLTAWHEKLRRLEQSVAVAAGKVVQVGITFRPSPETAPKASAK